MNFTFGSIYFLILILSLPCLFLCKVEDRQYYFSKLEWIDVHLSFNRELWLKLLIASLMILALLKPFIYEQESQNHKKGRDLVIALDASGSMGESGFDESDRYMSKYDTLLKLSKSFISNRFDDNIGLVLFGTFAYTASPITYDLKSLSFLLDMTNVGLAGESTAIGDAINQSIKTLSYGNAKSKVILLITDGYHNAGEVSPKKAVERAKKLGIRIYTIGVGKSGDFDKALLTKISKDTNGVSYQATNSKDLEKIYEKLDKLEPSPIRSREYLNQRLLIVYPLFFVLLLLVYLLFRSRL